MVKVRLQGQLRTHSSPNILSASEAFLQILKNEGWLSLYRGFLPTMAMSLPGTVVYFVGYEKVRDWLTRFRGKDEPLGIVPLISGSIARVFAATTVSPLELIRTRMQFKGIKSGKLRPVTLELANSIRTEGVSVLWRGLQPTLWRDVPFSAIYWSILEPSKKWMTRKLLSSRREGENVAWWETGSISFVCGALSGAIAAAITTPFDVAKTRQQLIQNLPIPKNISWSSSTWIQLRQIWREEGWNGVTRGMGPRVAKVAPACAIMIGSYELGKSVFKT